MEFSVEESATPVLGDVLRERFGQNSKWGFQTHSDGTNSLFTGIADSAKQACDQAAETGTITWALILTEEFWEALSETTNEKLRQELIQVAAVCVAWIEDIDRRDK